MRAWLLSEGKLGCPRRRQYQDNNDKLDALWDDYKTKRRTTSSLLRPCSVHGDENQSTGLCRLLPFLFHIPAVTQRSFYLKKTRLKRS